MKYAAFTCLIPAVFASLSSAVAETSAARPLEPLTNLAWRLPPCARIDGATLFVDVPTDDPEKNKEKHAHCEADLDIGDILGGGDGVALSVRLRARDVTKPDASWNGVKMMLRYVEEGTGETKWPGAKLPIGTFDWTNAVVRVNGLVSPVPPAGGRATLILGLQGCTGHAEFDLSTLTLAREDLGLRHVNEDYIVRYRKGERQGPHSRILRGTMLPARATTEDDIETLHRWGATLARFQIMRNWFMDNDCQDLDEYAQWIDSRLDNLADVLRWAEARGMKICVDLHSPPGGKRPGDRQMHMLFEEKYADAFVETWRRIATRFKGNPAIYGYDLVNEPHQKEPAKINYWEVQRRAAEAVRAIDPDTPIIIESNLAAAPSAFRYLSPLAMDNVIYQIHVYKPHDYTHQGVRGNPIGAVWPDSAKGRDRDFLRRALEPARAFQLRHHARIYVGEFSAASYAPGAENYLRDCIALFEEYGWDWTYHAFREADVWNVEKERNASGKYVPSANNPRKRVLLDGFRGIVAPQPVDWTGAMLVGRLVGRDNPFFAPGEEMVFEIRLQGAKGGIPPDTYFVDWERRGDDGVVEKGRAPLPTAETPLVIRTKSDRPGFVCVEANVVTADGKRVPKNHRWEKRVFFQGGAAVAPETLKPGTEPADYDAFWDAQAARLGAMPVQAELTPAPCADAGVRLYAVRIDCAGGRPVTGWLTVPADASTTNRYPAEVSYRGASRDDQPAPAKGPHDRIRFESNGHGFDLGKGAAYVKSFFDAVRKPGYEYGFDPESNADREKSYWLGMALRAARALQWIATLPEWDGKTVNLSAGSQGGWQALMAAATYPRAIRLTSGVSCSDDPGRRSCKITKISTSIVWGCDWAGQAEFKRLPSTYRPKGWNPAMAYFDAVFAARRVASPVEITRAGLGDYVSPPSSLAVLYNELRVPKKITWNQGWTHGWSPAGMAVWTVDGGFDAAMSRKDASTPTTYDAGALAAPAATE